MLTTMIANAFWAYIFAIWITKTDKLELKKACAVLLAIIGVMVISYGGAETSRSQADKKGLGSKLIGDLLAFAGSITFAGVLVGMDSRHGGLKTKSSVQQPMSCFTSV